MFEINLVKNKEKSLYQQIYEEIKAEILADKYTPDTKMPSIRKLASRLKVNTETIVKAYNLLASENLIYTKEGSGSYIAPAAALTNNRDDQRLKILSSKSFSAPQEIIDFSGPENEGEFLDKYAWNLVFNNLYKKYQGKIFKAKSENKYLEFLAKKNNSIEKNKLYYSSEKQKKEIAKKIIDLNKKLVFIKNDNNSFFLDLYQAEFNPDLELETEKPFLTKKNNIDLLDSDYKKIIKFLKNNSLDYLVISDESLENSVLNWDLAKLESLLKLASKYGFKIIIHQYFELYQENKKIKNLLSSKYKKNLILIQALTARVFPGLKMGIFYLDNDLEFGKNKELPIYQKYNLTKLIKRNNQAAGENLINNLLVYYLENGYLNKRIKFLKQRLKNRKLLLKSVLTDYLKEIEFIDNKSLFYFKFNLANTINQAQFKKFAENNSILVPDYKNFMIAQTSNQLIISTASVNQFSIKQVAIFLAKIYQEFINLN